MVKLKLAVVLFVYATVVCASMTALVVMFITMDNITANRNAVSSLTTTMTRNQEIINGAILRYQMGTLYLGASLGWFGVPKIVTPSWSMNFTLLEDSWRVMCMSLMSTNDMLVAFEMWQDRSGDGKWYMSGCMRPTSVCFLYDKETNVTYYVNTNLLTGAFDTGNPIHQRGEPLYYRRQVNFVAKTPIPAEGRWSPMYVDFSNLTITHRCHGYNVLKSITFFYCLDHLTRGMAVRSPIICKHVVGSLLWSRDLGFLDSLTLSPESITYLYSLIRVDNTNGVCDPDGQMRDAIASHLDRCNPEEVSLNACGSWLTIDKKYITTTIGVTEPTGLAFILVDLTPRSHYFYFADRGKHISISVSVIVIVFVVLVCVLVWIAIVVPIQWICRGIRKATTLSDDTDAELEYVRLYTLLSEVGDLYTSYLHLRQSLKELKAFVPQGLFVATPSSTAEANSILTALIAGVASSSDDEGGDRNDMPLRTSGCGSMMDGGDVDVTCSGGGRGGKMRPQCEPTLKPVNRLQQRRRRGSDYPLQKLTAAVCATSTRDGCPSLPSIGPAPPGGVNGDDDSPLPGVGRHRGGYTESGGTAKSAKIQTGIVPLICVDDDDDDAAAAEDETHRVTFVETPGADGLLSTAAAAMRVPPSSEAATLTQLSTTNHMIHGSLISGSGSPLLRLDLHGGKLNMFGTVMCSLLVVSTQLLHSDAAGLGEDVARFMGIAVKVVLRSGGVIEVLRPDFLVISFGAHVRHSQHVQLATACAITLFRMLPPKERARTHIIVDAGNFFVGNCGAHGRISRVVFGDRFHLCVDLTKYEVGLGRMLITDRVAACLPTDLVVPIDYIIPTRNRVYGIQLFHLLDLGGLPRDKDMKAGVARFRQAYGSAVAGDYAAALDTINHGRLYDPELGAIFASALKYLMELRPRRPRYCRFQLPLFEPLGMTIKERAAKYHHTRLSLTQINGQSSVSAPSINFGFGASMSLNERDDFGGSADINAVELLMMDTNQHQSQRAGVTAAGSGRDGGDSRYSSNMDGGGHMQGNSLEHSTAASPPLELPQTFTDHKGEVWHRLLTPIGSGSFADVYLGIGESGVVMALKCIRLSAKHINVEDVVSEVNTACKLFHDHVVQHIGWSHIGPYLILIMDYMSAGTLKNAIGAFPGGMTIHVAKRYALASLKGLAYLHKHNIVHADLKPQNILISTDGACKISDFGSCLSAVNAASAAYENNVFNLRGTAQYMSPEVAAGAAPSMRSDMWSYGVTLFEMLTGRLPWKMRREPDEPQRRHRRQRQRYTARSSGSGSAEMASTHVREEEERGMTEMTEVGSGSFSAMSITPPAHMQAIVKDAGLSMSNSINNNNTGAVGFGCDGAAPTGPEPTDAVSHGNDEDGLVDVVGLSDVRFVQGLATGSIVAILRESDLPTREAYSLLCVCLHSDPEQRMRASELVDHPFFIM